LYKNNKLQQHVDAIHEEDRTFLKFVEDFMANDASTGEIVEAIEQNANDHYQKMRRHFNLSAQKSGKRSKRSMIKPMI